MTQVADVFSNRYEIERELARGGMADVFLARDQLLDRPVAVKVLFPEFARDPSFVERFRREAQSAAGLNHPNIVAVYDWGQERGTYFIVMEYVEGRSLRDIIRAEGRLRPFEVARIGAEIADALVVRAPSRRRPPRHQAGQRADHRSRPGEAHRLRHRREPGRRDAGLTQTGAVMGTATYFSPEQAQGFTVDGRSRRLLARRRALRDGHRCSALHRREPGRGRDEARARGAAHAVVDATGPAASARVDHPRRDGQERRRALPVGRRSARRPAQLPARPSGDGRARGGRPRRRGPDGARPRPRRRRAGPAARNLHRRAGAGARSSPRRSAWACSRPSSSISWSARATAATARPWSTFPTS